MSIYFRIEVESVLFAPEIPNTIVMRNIFFLLMLIATMACCQKKSAKIDSSIFLQGRPLAELTNKRMEEASGLAASIGNPGLFWTHNDSGNKPEIFLIDEKLDIRLTCKLKGVKNRDWEDIAVGPGPEAGKNYVYVADIGDNMAMFQYKYIYRFEEPTFTRENELIISNFDTISFQLPDEKKDTESLLVHPKTKDIYVISKREEPVYVYELKYPYSTHDILTATKVMPLPFSQAVGADFSADGSEVIIKNYRNVYYWKVQGRPLSEALKERPYVVEYKEEPQGEAITFARDGSGFYTLSEKVKGESSYLYFYPRKKK
jgi:hypothetical protein